MIIINGNCEILHKIFFGLRLKIVLDQVTGLIMKAAFETLVGCLFMHSELHNLKFRMHIKFL